MTRGRDSNIAYVALDQPDDSHTTPEPDDVTARTVLLRGAPAHRRELSAHQTIEAEYELLRRHRPPGRGARDDRRRRSARPLRRPPAPIRPERRAARRGRRSTAFGPLTAALRRAEAYHHDLERLVPRIVGQHGLDDADDIAAVLRYRIDQLAASIGAVAACARGSSPA